MTMMQAVIKCLRKYATFYGRASRREYWWFFLFAFLFEWPFFLVSLPTSFSIPFTHIQIELFGETDPVNGFLKYLYFTISLFLLIPQWAVWARRMHDINKSGWSWLFVFLPIIGWFIILRRLLRHGDEGENDYGLPDNSPYVPKRKDRQKIKKRKANQNVEEEADTPEVDSTESVSVAEAQLETR